MTLKLSAGGGWEFQLPGCHHSTTTTQPPRTSRVTPPLPQPVMDYQGIYSWKYLVRKRRKWFIARTAFSEFPENTSLSGQLHPWTLYSREEPVWRKHSWTEQRRLRQDLQHPLAANSSTLKPCCSSYVCTLFLPNFINICHCQLQPERIPVSPSVSEKSLNWRQCLPRSVRIVGPLKLSQMLQGSINCCRRCSDVISHCEFCHSSSSWPFSWLNEAVW